MASTVSAAQPIAGRVEVVDGDTIKVDGTKERVRLFGIDAPESRQSCRNAAGLRYLCGARAADALAQIVGRNGQVACEEQDRDRYGRIVAICRLDGKDIGAAMVSGGWARDYAQYSHGRYAAREAEAKAKRRGAWAGRWQAPWEWRRERRDGG
ncbi:thermonuclease family protein [Aureimonas leprariae]|uniref:Thermonuclease family protein n=2 Tax=Plantimonas leprariae TaxID=2615207 RepID=A0A7V7PQJ9_9HYPH|nr:thermonuclease family protein [Aureimonas leprariae]